MNFCSDNVAGLAPEILAAIEAANAGTDASYGADQWTARLDKHLARIFERPVKSFPVVTGTAANALALAVMTPPFGAIYCHEEAHIMVDECGAPEMYTGGAKLIPLSGAHGKIVASALDRALAGTSSGNVHAVQPAVVSLTQATEAGTCYATAEIAEIAALARKRRMGVHMDGARFANAVAHLGATPAELTWRAGVDALSFGATKNGAMGAEIVVFFNETLAETFAYRRKRAGHLVSKMRFVSAQLDAYFTNDLWLKLAHHANAMAARLAKGLAGLKDARILHPVEANEVFVHLPLAAVAALREEGFVFYDWPGAEPGTIRLVTAFNTKETDVTHFLEVAGRLLKSRAA